MEKNVKLNQLIKITRIETGLNCSQLARLTNYSASYISQLENGKMNGTNEAYEIIFKALNIDHAEALKLCEEVDNKLKTLYRNIVFYNYSLVREIYAELNSMEDKIKKTIIYPEFIVMMMAYNVLFIHDDSMIEDAINYLSNSYELLDYFYQQVYLDYLGLYYKHIHQYDKAIDALHKSLSIPIQNLSNQSMIYYHLAAIYEKKNKLVSALNNNNKALDLFLQEKNVKRQLFTQVHIANILSRIGDYDEAQLNYDQLLTQFYEYGFTEFIPNTLSNASWNAIKNKDYNRALDYLKKEIDENYNNPFSNFHLALTHYYLGNYSNALEVIQAGYKLSEENSDPHRLLRIIEGLITNTDMSSLISVIQSEYDAMKSSLDHETRILVLHFLADSLKKAHRYKDAVNCHELILKYSK